MKVVINRDEVSTNLWIRLCKEVSMPTNVEQLCIKCDQVSACRNTKEKESEDGQSQRPLK